MDMEAKSEIELFKNTIHSIVSAYQNFRYAEILNLSDDKWPEREQYDAKEILAECGLPEKFDELKKAIENNQEHLREKLYEDMVNCVMSKMLTFDIDSIELDDMASEGYLSSMLAKSIRKTSGHFRTHDRVDVSNCTNVQQKVSLILNHLKNKGSHIPDSPIIKQLILMGEEAIAPLVEELDTTSERSHQFGILEAIKEVLGKLLNANHKSIILKFYKERQLFCHLVEKYRFPEAVDITFDLIDSDDHFSIDVFDAAIVLDEVRAVKALRKFALSKPRGVYATLLLATIPDLDIRDELLRAAKHPWSQQEHTAIAEQMLRRGMIEGIDSCIRIISRKTEMEHFYLRRWIIDLVRYHLGVRLEYDEILPFLTRNRSRFTWDGSRFSIPAES